MQEIKQEQGNKEQINKNKLIIVFGVPGSGKTTFAKQLQQKYYPDAILISGDKIQAEIYQKRDFYINLVKQDRNILQFYKQVQNKEYPRVEFDPVIWKQSRKIIEEDVNYLIKFKTVIIEDDFLYRSQRRIYQKISWHTNTPYIEIFMETSLQQCLQNIQSRKIKNKQLQCDITIEVLKKAFSKLQLHQHYEQNMIRVNFAERKKEFMSKQEIQQKMRVVKVTPNDPNDPNCLDYFHKSMKKEQILHSKQEQLQIVIKRFVGEIMHEGLQKIYGFEQLNEKAIEETKEKKKLAKILGQWKKHYVKNKQRTTQRHKIQENLINWLKEIYKEE